MRMTKTDRMDGLLNLPHKLLQHLRVDLLARPLDHPGVGPLLTLGRVEALAEDSAVKHNSGFYIHLQQTPIVRKTEIQGPGNRV